MGREIGSQGFGHGFRVRNGVHNIAFPKSDGHARPRIADLSHEGRSKLGNAHSPSRKGRGAGCAACPIVRRENLAVKLG